MSFFAMSPGRDEGLQTKAVVKWFDLTKGFGFVAPLDGSCDAFIHSSIITRAGLNKIAEGTKMVVRVGDGAKGRQVLDIVKLLDVDEEQRADVLRRDAETEIETTGTVKWFNAGKGFGFIVPDDNGNDIFVHRSTVLRAGLQTLESGQKVKIFVQKASKGREAWSLKLIE